VTPTEFQGTNSWKLPPYGASRSLMISLS